MREVKIKKEISLKDYRKLVYFNTFGKNKWNGYIFLATIIFCAIYVMYRVLFVKSLDLISQFGIMYYFFLLIFLMTAELNIRKSSKGENTLIGKKQEIVFRNNGIKVSNELRPSGESYAWDKIKAVYSVKDYFYIYMLNNQILIVYKDYMTYEQIDTLDNVFTDKIKENYFKRKYIIL